MLPLSFGLLITGLYSVNNQEVIMNQRISPTPEQTAAAWASMALQIRVAAALALRDRPETHAQRPVKPFVSLFRHRLGSPFLLPLHRRTNTNTSSNTHTHTAQ